MHLQALRASRAATDEDIWRCRGFGIFPIELGDLEWVLGDGAAHALEQVVV
jgi:hypothetical protein